METCTVRAAPPPIALLPTGSSICATVVGLVLLFVFLYWLFSPPAADRGCQAQGAWRNDAGLFGASRPQASPQGLGAQPMTPARGAAYPQAQVQLPDAATPRRSESGARAAMPEMTLPATAAEGGAGSPLSLSLQSPHLDDVEAEWFEGRRSWAVA